MEFLELKRVDRPLTRAERSYRFDSDASVCLLDRTVLHHDRTLVIVGRTARWSGAAVKVQRNCVDSASVKECVPEVVTPALVRLRRCLVVQSICSKLREIGLLKLHSAKDSRCPLDDGLHLADYPLVHRRMGLHV